jgi:predicted RNA binding protein YcfA (HicA-like mRNA interferase family)
MIRVRDVIRMIESDGWVLDRTRGDHRQYTHPNKSGLVTVSGHMNDEVMKGTFNSILKQAGLRKHGDGNG